MSMNLAMMKVFLSLIFVVIKFFYPIKVLLVEWIEERNMFQVELSNNAIFVKISLPRMRKP